MILVWAKRKIEQDEKQGQLGRHEGGIKRWGQNALFNEIL
jgi:hypothetical protein